MCSQDTYLQSSSTSWKKVHSPLRRWLVETELNSFQTAHYPYTQLFNYFYRILSPVTAVISFYRLLFLTKNFLRLKRKLWAWVNWALESVRAKLLLYSQLCFAVSILKKSLSKAGCELGQGLGPPEHYQLVPRKCGSLHPTLKMTPHW